MHLSYRDGRLGRHTPELAEVEAWLRRPWRLRVRTADGQEHHVDGGPPYSTMLCTTYERSVSGMLQRARDAVRGRNAGVEVAPAPPQEGIPVRRPDGLASPGRRPTTATRCGRATPGCPRWTRSSSARPGPGYDARCSCCPLLLSRLTMEAEYEDEEEPGGLPRSAWDRLPTTYRVGRGAATGVVVEVTPLDGELERHGLGTDIRASG